MTVENQKNHINVENQKKIKKVKSATRVQAVDLQLDCFPWTRQALERQGCKYC